MSGFAALMGAGGDASDIIERKKKAKAKEEADRVKAEASAAAAFADFKSKAGQSKWAESDDEDDFFSKPVRLHHSSACCEQASVSPCSVRSLHLPASALAAVSSSAGERECGLPSLQQSQRHRPPRKPGSSLPALEPAIHPHWPAVVKDGPA